MHKIIFLFFLLFFSSIIHAEKWPSYELTTTSQKQFPNIQIIKINNDPVYQTDKKYKAFPLNSIIKKLAKTYQSPIANSLIIFTARDGYKVTMSYPDAIKEHGYIAFKDLDANQGNWLKFKFGNEYITPSPFYLVWQNSKLDKWRYPAPFQLIRISLQSTESYFSGAAPRSKNSQVKQGFSLFSRYCMRCHSINHVGGNLAPELNHPKNITDYYPPDKLSRFILDAASFNSQTKMPVFKHMLKQKEVLLIQQYLKSMKDITPTHSHQKQ